MSEASEEEKYVAKVKSDFEEEEKKLETQYVDRVAFRNPWVASTRNVNDNLGQPVSPTLLATGSLRGREKVPPAFSGGFNVNPETTVSSLTIPKADSHAGFFLTDRFLNSHLSGLRDVSSVDDMKRVFEETDTSKQRKTFLRKTEQWTGLYPYGEISTRPPPSTPQPPKAVEEGDLIDGKPPFYFTVPPSEPSTGWKRDGKLLRPVALRPATLRITYETEPQIVAEDWYGDLESGLQMMLDRDGSIGQKTGYFGVDGDSIDHTAEARGKEEPAAAFDLPLLYHIDRANVGTNTVLFKSTMPNTVWGYVRAPNDWVSTSVTLEEKDGKSTQPLQFSQEDVQKVFDWTPSHNLSYMNDIRKKQEWAANLSIEDQSALLNMWRKVTEENNDDLNPLSLEEAIASANFKSVLARGPESDAQAKAPIDMEGANNVTGEISLAKGTENNALDFSTVSEHPVLGAQGREPPVDGKSAAEASADMTDAERALAAAIASAKSKSVVSADLTPEDIALADAIAAASFKFVLSGGPPDVQSSSGENPEGFTQPTTVNPQWVKMRSIPTIHEDNSDGTSTQDTHEAVSSVKGSPSSPEHLEKMFNDLFSVSQMGTPVPVPASPDDPMDIDDDDRSATLKDNESQTLSEGATCTVADDDEML